ncbi:hypothetical protein [Acinetobacter pittii]|uniref:Uncharacterized protein n=1 Tax=Acinetobacter pittii TaxID=48296 RepID=A0A3R9RUW0_ACIPI|nr:hypothetical protein [Acinetobacter pittii]HEM6651515.1 hypothetical protein [Acinetobacter baumannii]KQE17079.1 hypothetical protein APD36_16540 [Acinetobacter pittii]KRI47681.1 hypothetical protein APC42_10010 [Acinetobacter pittii]RSO51597.1 hypothetical protein EA758_14950 [Acinetobacter pittii]RSO57866.1 hypothetical protein EA752_14705 [Acinetobacter pittii]
MHRYIQEILNELEAQHENSVFMQWVEKILNDMHRIATEEANITNENKVNELQKRMNAALEIAEDLMQSMEMYPIGEKLGKLLKVPQPITFQAGDRVVIDSLIVSDRVLTIDEILEDGIILAGAFLPIRYLTQLRHAKPEEEATGYRNRLEGTEN